MTTEPQAPTIPAPHGPLMGVRVVEAALGTSVVGAGLATSLPGALLRDFGAEVTRVRSATRSTLDTGIEFDHVWDRGKRIVQVDDADPAGAATVTELARGADVLFLAGPHEAIERQGLDYSALSLLNPRLVVVRLRPGHTARGAVGDLELLLDARLGLLTQIRHHQPGRPAFPDLTVASAGAGLAATVGALAGLYERVGTGRGGWAETSLADGLRALLPMIIGRVEHPSPTTTLLWRDQGPKESLAYRCADGEYIQLWFGAKGAYEAFLAHLGEPPSERGYNADLMSGAMVERGARWAAAFARRPRAEWLAEFAGHDFRCEPVLRPGEALADPHVRQTGLSVTHPDPDHGSVTVLGPIARVTASDPGRADRTRPATGDGRLLSGVRVLDLSAYLAGPVATAVLAELGADVVKVEPVTGDVHRTMEPMFAAGQRGKRAVALDLKAPGADRVLAALFAGSDVVHHNSRVGLAERLGYDEATVRAANPDAVYCHASGFGATGPRAKLPANDHLMQALSGVEGSQGGAGQPPTFLVWGAIDSASGWVAACGILAGLYARRRGGGGQSVATSLLGAGLMLKSGAFLAGDATVAAPLVVSGPVLDAEQTGYGAAYRLYQAADGGWLALAVPDAAAWRRLRDALQAGLAVASDSGSARLATAGQPAPSLSGLPADPPPLRTTPGDRQPAEEILEAAFAASGTAAGWVARLRAAGVPAELVAEVDRAGFIANVLDDPVDREIGRTVSFDWGARGRTEQPGFALRLGPAPRPAVRVAIPGLGEHTAEVLGAAGFDVDAQATLADAGAIPPSPLPAAAHG
ncbi:CoA transferase [Frankia sp. AgB1.9]|uniref:CaiB/BaiF CoA-transferase family protein n=1 Tax=unclassified Frankia TaxID=2632575 RepID=UPI001932FAFD|nr:MULTISPECIES: CoA transferase [unclassified Frankia]MBL7493464.1 CoA transferase [Frankia sp. AgW1.1]MBL7549033.1 CoA transferase [Frankia sp. AgB1.9]MBL7619994.1 CoA transferase [Frankia sp. AgB1.8]